MMTGSRPTADADGPVAAVEANPGSPMPFWTRHPAEEALLWCQESRLAAQVADAVSGCRILELDSGWCVIGPAEGLAEPRIADLLDEGARYGLAPVGGSLPVPDRHLHALAAAVQLSGLADRIGMGRTQAIVATKLLDLFFALRARHEIVFQPIVDLATFRTRGYECLLRPASMIPVITVTDIVNAALATGRSVELDTLVLDRILERAPSLVAAAPADSPLHLAINAMPASLLAAPFEARALAARVRGVGLSPRQVTFECTEQQAIPDVVPLRRRVRELRRAGFGVAVDDAGAGYASFSLIAALRPSVIKIDRQIVHGIHGNVAKRALVEAFVSFAGRIGARLVAEGIEGRADLEALIGLGVHEGQGWVLGHPAAAPGGSRRSRTLLAIEASRTMAAGAAHPGVAAGAATPSRPFPGGTPARARAAG